VDIRKVVNSVEIIELKGREWTLDKGVNSVRKFVKNPPDGSGVELV
jgi:hypothetical protein